VKDAGGVWTLQQTLTPSVADVDFGYAVAVDGEIIVVGATAASNNVGAVYVFERSDIDWSQTQILTPSDNAADGQFGYAVDVEGDMIVVVPFKANTYTAPFPLSRNGAVYVFALNCTTT
jgi:hypothetical protein